MSIRRYLRKSIHEISEKSPVLKKSLFHLWDAYDRVRFRYSVFRNLRESEYNADIEPYRLHTVDADDIKYYCDFDFATDAGRVIGGEWDKEFEEFDASPLHHMFRHRFEKGGRWEETKKYGQQIEKIRCGEHTNRRSVKQYDRVLSEYDKLYESIKEEGYRTQKELLEEGGDSIHEKGMRSGSPFFSNTVLHEIAVSVGRNGDLYLVDGRHRLSIAKILDIEIPVRIVVRHEEWQKLRDEIAREVQDFKGDSTELHRHIEKEFEQRLDDVFLGLDHPDLAVLTEDSEVD